MTMTISSSILAKYVADLRAYVFDYSQMSEIIEADSITSINSITATPSGLTLGTQTIAGKLVVVVLSGGTAGTLYTISCIITTSSGAVLEGVGQLQVV